MKKHTVTHKQPIGASELIYSDNHTIYHIGLRKEEVGDIILLVGDPGRVKLVGSFFDSIEHEASNREYNTLTGTFNGKKVTVMSTGIGTDNMEIAITELDALFNIDPETRTTKEQHHALTFVRIGTSGSLQEDIPVDTPLVSEYALGLDNLNLYYDFQYDVDEQKLHDYFTNAHEYLKQSYIAKADTTLFNTLKDIGRTGVTLTAPGFFGPQGRIVRVPLRFPEINESLRTFETEGHRLTNYEMETSSLYALSSTLGHRACTICAIIANRYRKEYSSNYNPVIRSIVEETLQRLTNE